MSPLLSLFVAALSGTSVAATQVAPELRNYRVGPGDVLQVRVYGEPELSGAFPVNDMGELNYPLLGGVPVHGQTTDEVSAWLLARLDEEYLQGPQITVWLDAYNSQPVPVLGAVSAPGLYYLKGPTTVLDVLGQAGGMLAGGASEVRITHGGSEDNVTVVPVAALIAEGKGNIQLRPGDLVFVPEGLVSVMGSVGQPGEVAYREGLTVSQTIAAAGGATSLANLGRVVVLRGDQTIEVNVRRVLAGRGADVTVRAGDRVFVKTSVF